MINKKFSKKLEVINPNLVIVTGDRIETVAMTLAASYMNIPIAHIQAGDKLDILMIYQDQL